MRKMMMKRGFTLAEVLVTVTVVAVIAAVVLPAVVRQATAGDPARVGQDLVTIKTGIALFSQNVRPRMPGDVEDLVNKIEVTDKGADGTVYTSAHPDFWTGPYMEWTAPATLSDTDAIFSSAASAQITNALYRCPGTGTYATAEGISGTEPCTVSTNTSNNTGAGTYLSVRVDGIPGGSAEFLNLNEIFDGAETGNDAKDLGLVRQNASGTIFFLAVPYAAP